MSLRPGSSKPSSATRRGRRSQRDFLRRSYARLADHVPLRELDVADALDEETLSLSYLYLRDEFGAGRLSGVPLRTRWAHPL